MFRSYGDTEREEQSAGVMEERTGNTFPHEEDEPEEKERVLLYHYDRPAWLMIRQATALFRKVAVCPDLQPIDLISVAKVIQILEDMPLVPPVDGSLGVTVGFPDVRDGDNTTGMYLTFYMEDRDITLSYSGHTYDPAVGGDSFTYRRIELWADDEADVTDNVDRCLWIPGVMGLEEAIETLDTSAGVALDVIDDDPFRDAYLE